MLRAKVSLHDINDVEAFVITCVKRSGSGAPSEYWDDLVAEGIVLLYIMAKNYKAKIDGYDNEGKFSGYAIMWLPKQIKQAWHKGQEHHLHMKDKETGRRQWTYRQAPVSFEVATSRDYDDWTGYEWEQGMRTMNEFIDVPESTGGSPSG